MAQPAAAVVDPPSSPGLAPPTRIPALDGLRGIAVLGVLLFHAGYLDGGFLGVDLFFVLSGFLITGLLLGDVESTGRIRLGPFYARRVRRLAPALLVVVAAIGVLAPVFLDDALLGDVRDSGVASLLYYANWHDIGGERDYWAALAGQNPFEHTWSLAIEEQVYVAWPLLLVAALALARRGQGRRWSPSSVPRMVLGVAVALGALSLLALAVTYEPGGSTARAYYGTDTRAFAVLAGAAAAAALRTPAGRRRAAGMGARVVAAVAGLGLAAAWVAVEGTDSLLYRGLLPVLGVAGAIVVGVVAVTGGGRLAPVLSAPPVVGFGLISYGLYLWHWPVFVVLDEGRAGFGGIGLATARIAASIALATVSYVVVERPVRFGRVGTERWRVMLPAGLLVAAGALLLGTAGDDDDRRPSGAFGESASAGVGAAPDGRPRLLVLGDSQAFELAYRAGGPGYERFQVASSTYLGCGIGPGLPVSGGVAITASLVGESCDAVLDTWRAAVADFDPDIVLVHLGAWEVLDRRVGDRDIAFGSGDWDALTRTRLSEVMTALDGSQRSIVWLAAPCFTPVGASGGPPERGDPSRVARWNELLRGEASAHAHTVLPYDDYTCNGPARAGYVDATDFRRDGVHLTPAAAPLVWSWIAEQLP